MKWRYSLRWKLPSPCPGKEVLVTAEVEAGQPAPESVMSLWVAGAGYAVCLDFISDRPVRRWAKNVRLRYDGGIWRNVLTGMHHCLRMN